MAILPQRVHVSYPTEVEDIFDAFRDRDPLGRDVNVAGISGFVVVAAARVARAHLFALMGGDGAAVSRHVLSLPLPVSGNTNESRSPHLAVWNASSRVFGELSVAALDPSGSLRFYSNANINTKELSRPQELRVSRALSLSARCEDEEVVEAIGLVRANNSDGRDSLFIFGGRGSAAIVRLGEFAPSVEPLAKDVPGADPGRGGITFGRLFHAALRSIGGDSRPDVEDFEGGTGAYEIVGSFALKSAIAAFVARRSGVVELWGAEHLLWSCDVFELSKSGAAPRDRRIIMSAISKDDAVICLVEEVVEGRVIHRIIGFVASTRAPQDLELEIDLGDLCNGYRDRNVSLALSDGIAYFHLPGTNLLQWVSVARGLEDGDQVRGCIPLGDNVAVLRLLDASSNISPSAESIPGGVIACMCSDGIHMVSSGVPAPLSLPRVDVAENREEQSVTNLLWIAQAQFSAGQIGATSASLRAFYSATFVNGASSRAILGDVVLDTCQRIISSQFDPNSQPIALLVDSELERRQSAFSSFVRLLGDPEVFAGIREDARTIADDRLWDALAPDVRHGILSLGEKLAAAIAIRQVENEYNSRSSSMRYRDPAATSIIGSEVHGTRTGSDISIFGDGLRELEEQFTGGGSIVADALQKAGSFAGAQTTSVDQSSFLYRFPLHFHLFLPALRDCLVDIVTKVRQPQDVDSVSANGILRALRAMTSLACDAAVAVTNSAREARTNVVSQLERDRHVLRSFDEWSCSEVTRRALDVFVESALERCAGGRQHELDELQRKATAVTDELLACTCRALSDAEVPNSMSGMNVASSTKRRRITDGDDKTSWGRARTKALHRLRLARLTADTLRLAEKYRDFGTIMSLKVEDENFDEYFVAALDMFGDEFAFYAFRWLEDKGEIKLLLKGKSPSSAGLRLDRVNSLLATYLTEERHDQSNLEWMHWLSTNDVPRALRSLAAQTRLVCVPGRPNSLHSTKTLASIAKLSVLASAKNVSADVQEEMNETNRYLDGVLLRSRIQERLGASQPANQAILEADELVFRFLDDAPTESQELADHVVVALEAIKLSDFDGANVDSVSDKVWNRCLERERETWREIVAGMYQMSDNDIRSRMKKTALYHVAERIQLDLSRARAMAERGVFHLTYSSFDEESAHRLRNAVVETIKLAETAPAETARA